MKFETGLTWQVEKGQHLKLKKNSWIYILKFRQIILILLFLLLLHNFNHFSRNGNGNISRKGQQLKIYKLILKISSNYLNTALPSLILRFSLNGNGIMEQMVKYTYILKIPSNHLNNAFLALIWRYLFSHSFHATETDVYRSSHCDAAVWQVFGVADRSSMSLKFQWKRKYISTMAFFFMSRW